jgi:hypothetical protein
MAAMKRMLGAVLSCGVFVVACGGPDKPPLTPDGPNETMPAGSDAGDLAPAAPSASAAATPGAPAAPAAPGAPAKPAPKK